MSLEQALTVLFLAAAVTGVLAYALGQLMYLAARRLERWGRWGRADGVQGRQRGRPADVATPPAIGSMKVFEWVVAVLGTTGAVLAVIPAVRHAIIHFLSPDAIGALLVTSVAAIGILVVLLVKVGRVSYEKPRARGNVGPIDTLTWADADYAMKSLAEEVAGFRPNVVVGIDRGGAIVAGVLAKHLRLPVSTIASNPRWMLSSPEGSLDEAIKTEFAQGRAFQRILIVDDALRFGTTMRRAVEVLRRLRPDSEIRTAVLLCLSASAGPTGRDRLGPHKANPDYLVYTTTRQDVRLPWDTPR